MAARQRRRRTSDGGAPLGLRLGRLSMDVGDLCEPGQGRVPSALDLLSTMYDEHDLIDSPLNQTHAADGRSVEIHIYRMPHTGWTLEVVDDLNNSTVWDGEFATDQEALDIALAEINAEGIVAFITRPSSQNPS
jgi:hypothetical protein